MDASGVAPLAMARLGELGLLREIPGEFLRFWEADRLHAELQCELQRREASRITSELSNRGIPHAFVKGFVLREWLYEPTWTRGAADLDILIRPQDRELVRSLLNDLDFIQSARTDDFRLFRPATADEIARTEAEHFELAQFARILRLVNGPPWLMGKGYRRLAPSAFELRDGSPILNSVVDVHWALHFLFVDDDPLSAVEIAEAWADGLRIPTVSPTWHVLFTAFKLYFETFERPGWGLQMLVDLAALLEAFGHVIDWPWLEMEASKKGLEAMLFYTLAAAEQVIDESPVPQDLMERLAVVGFPSGARDAQGFDFDRGDFVPFMLRRRIRSAFATLDGPF